jgi:Carboxypeptidase regulatory-like domain
MGTHSHTRSLGLCLMLTAIWSCSVNHPPETSVKRGVAAGPSAPARVGESDQQQSPGPVRNDGLAAAPATAQEGPVSVTAVKFAESQPVAEVALQTVSRGGSDVGANPPPEKKGPENGPIRRQQPPSLEASRTIDPVVQTSNPMAMPTPITSFEGVSSQDNAAINFFRVLPPDTNGGVGPNHYVQFVNDLMRVYDKSGGALTQPFKVSALFVPLGGICASNDNGDGVVLYDPLANRWLVSQFAFGSISSPPYHECIALSMTSDPTGGYYLYDFALPGAEFPDYPHLGVWSDGYYMTTNQFLNGGPFDGTGAFAFNRAKMLAGDPTANLIYFNLNLASHPEQISGALPSDFDGMTPPPAGRANTFAYFTSTKFSDPADGLRLFDFHADFAVPANSTFTERAESTYAAPLAVAAFDPTSPDRASVQQPPPGTNTTALDAITDRLMHRLQYRNTGSDERLVITHTVGVPGSITIGTFKAAPRYYELRRALPGGNFTVNEQATFAPDTDNRFVGSAAEDNQGNLAVGYSVSSTTTFPSIRYAGRLWSDPPNGLFQGEASIIAGSGSQQSSTNRWGDYSAMSVDPSDDCTFWYTQEYYTAAGQNASTAGWQTRIANFRFPGCTAPPMGTLQGTVTLGSGGGPVAGALVQVSDGHSAGTLANGTYSIRLSPGNYTVQVLPLPNSCAPPSASPVSISNGNTTTLDATLAGSPKLTFQSASFGGNNGNGNGEFDRNECNDVTFIFGNSCSADTNISATLATSTPGVTIVQPNSPLLDVSAGGTTMNTTPFRVSTSLDFLCGTPIDFTLTKTSSQGTAVVPFTMPSCNGGVAANITGSIAAGDPLQTGRLFRDGARSTCASTKSVTLFDSTPRRYDSYTFTNGNATACATVSLTSSCDVFAAAYSGSFNPANILQNYLADPGNSTVGGQVSWSFNVGPGQTFVVVVYELNANSDCSSYSLLVSGIFTDEVGPGACGQLCVINPMPNLTVPVDPGKCGATVNYGPLGSTGSCGPLVGSPASGSFFPIGLTTVTVTSSSTATSKFTVYVPHAANCPVVFTDDPLVVQSTLVKAVHIMELREFVNLMRTQAGLGQFNFTNANVTGFLVKASDIMELRQALDPARAVLGKPPIAYARNPLTAGITVLASDVNEIRNGVK